MKYKYFIFDWDGCLARTLQVWLDAYTSVYKEYGLNPEPRDVARHFGDWRQPAHFGIDDIDSFNIRLKELISKNIINVELYPGAKDLLESLRGSQVALVSASPREVIEPALRRLGVDDCFKVVICAEDVTHHKPHPESLNKALAALGGPATEAIMIGDSRKDLGAAANAGMDSLLMYPQSHKVFYDLEDLKTYKPVFIAGDFTEAQKILLAK